VQNLVKTTEIDLKNGCGIPELEKFQKYLNEYRIVVYGWLNCVEIIFDGMVDSERRLNLLYDDVTRHCHVIASLTGAMAKRYVCRGCGKGCQIGETHKCAHACSECMSVPPFSFSGTRIPCLKSEACNKKRKTNKQEARPSASARDCVTRAGAATTPERNMNVVKHFA
jgi:hypothetical protein